LLAVTRPRHPLLRTAYGLFLGLTMLCVTAMPMLAAAHDLHEVEHLLADAGDAAADPDPDGDGGMDQLHAEDGCLHSMALVSVTMRWTLPVRRSAPPSLEAMPPPLSPSARFLRPPIA
jgi:hypothetical protein